MPPRHFAAADEAARKALAIDSDNVEALVVLAYQTSDFDTSMQLFNRAIELNPSFATAYQWRANNSVPYLKPDEVLPGLRRAYALDPRSRIIGNNLAAMLMLANRPAEAIEVLARAEAYAPDYNENLELEFMTRLFSGDLEGARRTGRRLAEVRGKDLTAVEPYLALFTSGSGEAAASTILAWPRSSRGDPNSPVLFYDYNTVLVLARAGQYDAAFEVLRFVFTENASDLNWTLSDVTLEAFYCQPRVRKLVGGLDRERDCSAL